MRVGVRCIGVCFGSNLVSARVGVSSVGVRIGSRLIGVHKRYSSKLVLLLFVKNAFVSVKV